MPIVINGTTGISGVDGSAGTPSYQGNDTNTGVFFPAADTIAFAEGGVEVARFDSSGNLGIGTSSPANRLSVVGGNVSVNQTNATITVVGGDNTNLQQIRVRMSGTDGILDVTRNSGTSPNLLFGTEGTERMRIDSSGNVAIGTTSASGRLTVASTGTAIDCPLTNGSITLREAGGSSANNTVELHVRPAAGRSGYLSFTENAVADRWSIGIQNGVDALRFMNGSPTGGTERMRITSGGGVSIGTTNSFATLTVNGNISPAQAPSSNWGLDFAPSTSSGTFVTIANNATYALAVGSGLIWLWDDNANGIAQIYCFYGTTTVTNIFGGMYTSVQNNPGTVNVYYDAGTNKYTIQNRQSSRNLWISTIRMRASS